MKFGETPRGNDSVADAGLPAPPLPGLPPVPASPVQAPGPRPKLKSMKMASVSTFDESALELEAEDLLETLDADEAAPAEAQTQLRPHRTTTPPVFSQPTPDTTRPGPMSVEVSLTELATLTDRNRIVEVLMGHAALIFDVAVLFAVRDQMAFGWKAFGSTPGVQHVEHLLIPLDAPSVVQAATVNGLVHGPITPSTVNNYMYKVLGCSEPRHATAGVVMIGKRAVNILYGHGRELTPLQIEDLRAVCIAAAEAYARLIAVQKKKK
jgi:hypothetical protein